MFQRAKLAGFSWVAVQDGDPDHPNDAFYAQCRLAAASTLMTFGIWSQPPRTERAIEIVGDEKPSFFIANIESDVDRVQFDPHAFREAHPDLDCAVATTGGGFDTAGIGDDPVKAKPFIDAGFDYIGEAYLNENPNATPNALNERAKHCLWPGASIVLGVYHDYPATAYQDRTLWAKDPQPWSVYLAETLTDADWATFARWNGAHS